MNWIYYHIHYQLWLNAGRYYVLPLVRRQCPLNRVVPNAYFSPPFKRCKQQMCSPENCINFQCFMFQHFLTSDF